MKRRHLFGAGALLSALALVALPSSAAAPSKFTGKGAGASWYLGDAQNTSVSLGIFDGTSGKSQTSKDLFVDVYQIFCDAGTNELVEHEYFTYEPAGDAAVSISSKLDKASATGTVDLTGVEVRTPNCANPDYENATYTDLGEFVVTVAGSWTGTGATVRSSYNYRFDAGPGCKFSSRGSSRSRDAAATGSIDGDLSIGSFAGSDYASIFQTRDMSRDVSSGCFIR